ncbi:MAG: TetR-like C-terminal domain-containing protein, partial [Acidobacteriota bacterium]
ARAHLMFGGFLDPSRRSDELATAIEESFAKLVAAIRRGEESLYRALPTRDLVLTFWSATHGLSMLATSGQLADFLRGAEPDALAERLIENLLSGLAR